MFQLTSTPKNCKLANSETMAYYIPDAETKVVVGVHHQ